MSKIYNCNIYIKRDDEVLINDSFINIAENKHDVAKKIKNVLDSIADPPVTFDEIIYANENQFNSDNHLYISITATHLFSDIDGEKIDKIFDDVEKSSYKNRDILYMIKDLIIGYKYDIIFLKQETLIEKSEILYYGKNDTYEITREDCDYNKNGINKFKKGDKVKIKYLESSPIFVIDVEPNPICTCIDWMNVYELCVYNRKQEDPIYANIHESELEKVEE